MHYERVRNTGDVGSAKPSRKAAGEGHLHASGYRTITVDGKSVLEHRHILEKRLGRPLLPQETGHHRNGQRADNRPDNLELWSKAQPAGQRISDKLEFALEMIRLYKGFLSDQQLSEIAGLISSKS